jgi:hypothetical protein
MAGHRRRLGGAMRSRCVLTILMLLGLTACEEMELVVESNTDWSGEVQGIGEVGGTGNRTIDVIDGTGDRCWVLRKTTESGVLRAYLRDKARLFGSVTEYDGDQSTSEPYGEIGGCNT